MEITNDNSDLSKLGFGLFILIIVTPVLSIFCRVISYRYNDQHLLHAQVINFMSNSSIFMLILLLRRYVTTGLTNGFDNNAFGFAFDNTSEIISIPTTSGISKLGALVRLYIIVNPRSRLVTDTVGSWVQAHISGQSEHLMCLHDLRRDVRVGYYTRLWCYVGVDFFFVLRC